MVIKSFLDGGNQADSTQYDTVSLASISGTPSQWRALESGWKSTLKTHNAPWLHTTDALTLNDPYTEAKGWTHSKAHDFISACAQTAENHLAVVKADKVVKPGLTPHVITIVLSDFIRAGKDNPEVPNDATLLCAVQSVFLIWERGNVSGVHFYHLIFDQNEPYISHIADRMKNHKARKVLASFLERIVHLARSGRYAKGTGPPDGRSVRMEL